MSEAKKIVRLLAIQLAPQRIELVPFYEDELVKAGLADLLEAGQAMREALERINDVRNSLIGYQGFNFSMHAYPLVAALEAVGIKGMDYEEARGKLKEINARIEKWQAEANERQLGTPPWQK